MKRQQLQPQQLQQHLNVPVCKRQKIDTTNIYTQEGRQINDITSFYTVDNTHTNNENVILSHRRQRQQPNFSSTTTSTHAFPLTPVKTGYTPVVTTITPTTNLPSSPTTTRPTIDISRWQLAKHRMDFYCRSIFSSLIEMRTACTKMISLDYAHELENQRLATYLSVVIYRYNVINWACDFYGMHHMSTSTVSILAELFDKYFIKSLERREETKLQSLFQNRVKLVMASIVFTKIAMEYNEDKNRKLTSEDVNKYLIRDSLTASNSSSQPARQCFITRGDFMECERDILNTVEFCLWDIRSPKGIFEMFLTLLPTLFGYENKQERSLFPYYCRYVYDICQLDYEICNTFSVNTFLACVLYISKLHWPSNYMQVLRSCNENNKQQRQNSTPQTIRQQQQQQQHVAPEYKKFQRDSAWLIALLEGFDITIDTLQNESERLLRLMETNSCHSHHALTYMAKRYLSVEVGCAHAVGFPTLAFFQQYKM